MQTNKSLSMTSATLPIVCCLPFDAMSYVQFLKSQKLILALIRTVALRTDPVTRLTKLSPLQFQPETFLFHSKSLSYIFDSFLILYLQIFLEFKYIKQTTLLLNGDVVLLHIFSALCICTCI